MKVLITVDAIKRESLHSSILIYIMRILSCIKDEEKHNYVLFVRKEMEKYMREHFPGFKMATFDGKGYNGKITGNNPVHLLSLCRLFKKIIKDYNIDCLLDLSGFAACTLVKLNCKKIVVVHDLKALKVPIVSVLDAIKRWGTYQIVYKRSYSTADAIIAISKYTRQDILTYYPFVSADKIHVVYNSVILPESSKEPSGFPRKDYILFVNTLQLYKNVITLLRAFNMIKDKTEKDIVIVGKCTEYWEETIVPYLKNEGILNRVIRLENLTDEELKYMYEHASLFVTPSLNEGFGYTPIEAAICGCPVISSIEEALPDSTKGLLNYYYPAMDEKALADKMLELMNNPPSKEELNRIASIYKEAYSSERQWTEIKKVIGIG